MNDDPMYVRVGALDYVDSYGSLTQVFNCSRCYALVNYQEGHSQWHRDQEFKHILG